jgi:PAS domain S-box-containing protein
MDTDRLFRPCRSLWGRHELFLPLSGNMKAKDNTNNLPAEEVAKLRRRVSLLEKSEARLKEAAVALSQQVNELASLNEFSQKISSNLARKEVLKLAGEQVLHAVSAEMVLCYLRQGDGLTLTNVRTGRSKLRKPRAGVERLGRCACEAVALEGKPVYRKDILTDPRCTQKECHGAGVRSLAALPLRMNNAVLGVIVITSVAERDFSRHANFLQSLTAHVAVALQNSLLYEEVESHVRQLERGLSEKKENEKALKESEARFRALVEQLPNTLIYMAALDERSTTLYVSPQIEALLGYTQEEYKADPDIWAKSIHQEDCDRVMAEVARCHESGERLVAEYRIRRRDGREIWFHDEAKIVYGEDGEAWCLLGTNTDITGRKQAEEDLRARESELLAKAERLQELNAALRVILEQRRGDKAELEMRLQSNVNQLVLPHVERLKRSRLDPEQLGILGALESNLKEIVSSFVTTLASKFLSLTPTELRVASLIKDGRTTKEIAALLQLSENTIQSHKFHIRSKLGLKNREINLRSYLRSLPSQ